MALRDDLRRRFGYVENPRTIGSQWMSDTAERYADAVLDLLRDPAHRDELLAMLLGPDGAEPPRKVPADCPHDRFESDGGHEFRRCVQCGLGGGAEREASDGA